jgi:hypothetical protein
MSDPFELPHFRKADGNQLSDAHFGLLLDALQLGTDITARPERLRLALGLIARDRSPIRDTAPTRRAEPLVRAA